MKEIKNNETSQMSLSKSRKIERKKQIARDKKNAVINRIVSIFVAIVVCVGAVWLIGNGIYRSITKVRMSENFSAAISDNGLIKNVTAKDIVTLPTYKGVEIPLSEVEFSDEDVDKAIKKLLEENQVLNKDPETKIQDEDKVNIDYVGSVDGVEFEGGNSQGNGSDLTIGSNSFVDTFEEQLIGHAPGEEVTVNVTFPEDYREASLAGKAAVFKVTINGVYKDAPEFNDEFVKEHLSEEASSAEEYITNLKEKNYEEKLNSWVVKYLMDKSTVASYPKNYIKSLKSTRKYQDYNQYLYVKQFYQSIGSQGPATFEAYLEMSEAKYDKGLEDAVKDQAKLSLIVQAIYETEGLSVDVNEYGNYFENEGKSLYEEHVDQYGKGFAMQNLISTKVLELVKEQAVIE